MMRMPLALVSMLVAQPALAEDKCARREIVEGNVTLGVYLGPIAPGAPSTTLVSVTAVSDDRKLTFHAAYELAPDGTIAPRQFYILAPSGIPASQEPHAETIRWRQDDGPWKTLPRAIYPSHPNTGAETFGDFMFQVAQRSEFRGLTYGTEALDELRKGGRYVVTRLGSQGEELATGAVDYPDQSDIDALFAQVHERALEALAPCGPWHVIRQAK